MMNITGSIIRKNENYYFRLVQRKTDMGISLGNYIKHNSCLISL